MARLNWTGWCGIAGVAIVATLTMLPSTAWIAQSNARVATGRLRGEQSWEATLGDIDAVRRVMAVGVVPRPSTVQEELYNALAPVDHDRVRANLEALSDKHPDNALIQAELGRYASQIVYRGRLVNRGIPLPARRPQPDADTAAMIAMLKKAGERGERADPNNAHFPLLLATAYRSVGNEVEAWRALERAAAKTKYSDYTADRCNLVNERLTDAGLRSNAELLEVSAMVVLPYYAHFKRLVQERIASETGNRNLVARLQTIKLAEAMAKGSDTVIGILVADACGKIAVMPPGVEPNPAGRRRPAGEFIKWANDLQKNARNAGVAIPGFDAAKAMRGLLQLEWSVITVIQPKIDAYPVTPFPGLGISAMLLLGLVLVAPVGFAMIMGRSLREHEGAGLALPLLPPLIVALALTIGGRLESPASCAWTTAQIVILLAGFLVAWLPRLRPAVAWCVYAAFAIGLVGPIVRYSQSSGNFESDFESVVSFALAISWLLSRGRPGRRAAWVIVSLQMVGVAMSTAAMGLWLVNTSTPLGFLGFALLAVLLAACFGPLSEIPIRAAIGPILLVVGLAYGIGVRNQLAADRAMAPFVRSFIEEGSLARSGAGSIDVERLEKEALKAPRR